jgi:hypothetical protein
MNEPTESKKIDEPLSINKDNALEFGKVAVFYNFLFDLGQPTDPTEAARTLLKNDFALSAANYSNEDLEVAERFKNLEILRKKAQSISIIEKHLHDNDWGAIAKLAIRQPIFAGEFAFNVIKILIRYKTKETKEKSKTPSENANDIVGFIDDSMVKIQWIEALKRHVDRTLFAPQYLQEIPFARVGLQPFFIEVETEKISIDVEVLIHRTGVAILTFYIIFSDKMTTQEIINLNASTLSFNSLEIVQQLVELTPGPTRKPSETRYSGGVYWCKYEADGDNKGTLSDVFEMYHGAIISAIHNKKPSKQGEPWSWLRSSTWLAYPIIFIGDITPSIVDYEIFKEKYPIDLAGLIARYPQSSSLRQNKIMKYINSDVSINKDYSLFIESSHSLVIYYENKQSILTKISKGKFPSPEWISTYFNTSVVIDILLVQRCILIVLNDKIKMLSLNLDTLNQLKREVLLGLEEYSGIVLSHGSAQDIIKQKRTAMGNVDLYNNLKQKMDNLEKLIDVEESRRHAKLDILIKFATFFGTIIFGLVGAWNIVKIIIDWKDEIANIPEGWIRTSLETLNQLVQNDPIGVALLLYGIFVIIFVIIIVWHLKPLNNLKPIVNMNQSSTANKPGFKWPIKITINRGNKK